MPLKLGRRRWYPEVCTAVLTVWFVSITHVDERWRVWQEGPSKRNVVSTSSITRRSHFAWDFHTHASPTFWQVPKGLQKKIRTFYEYLWDSGQDSHSSGLFEEMPEKLKLQLNIALKKRLIDQVNVPALG